jgi:hypothetical protein
MRTMTLLATAAILTLTAGAANAATTLKFVLTGDVDAVWTLPASPVPDFTFPAGGFSLSNVAGTLGGQPATIDTLELFADASFGGLSLISGQTVFFSQGPQLYTGPDATPTFRTGVFTLARVTSDFSGDGTLTVTNAVPEPASWAMMIAGFGLVGAAMRRRAAAVA